MEIDPDLLKMKEAMDALRGFLLDAVPQVGDPEVRGQVQSLADEIGEKTEAAMRELPAAFTELEKQVADAQKVIAQSVATMKALKAAQPKPAPPAPTPEEPPLEPKDAALGPRLREELLDRYFGAPAEEKPAATAGMGWSTFLDAADRTPREQPKPASERPEPPPKPTGAQDEEPDPMGWETFLNE